MNRESARRKPQIRGETRANATRGAASMERRKARRLDRDKASWSSSNGGVHEHPTSNQSIFQTKTDQPPCSWVDRPIDDTDVDRRPKAIDPDLRRRTRREHAEMLAERAAFLPAHDRELVEAVYHEGLSVAGYVRRQRDRDIVRWTERAARRRLRRLVERLASPRFVFVLGARSSWPLTRRRVAVAVVIQGRSLRETARSLGLSLHAVRRHIDAVEALYTEALYTEARFTKARPNNPGARGPAPTNATSQPIRSAAAHAPRSPR